MRTRDEEHKKRYGDGAKDSRKTGVGGHLIHDFGDFIIKLIPHWEDSKNKSYEKGWHDHEDPKHRYPKKQKKQKSSGSGGGGYSNSSTGGNAGLVFALVILGGVIGLCAYAINYGERVGREGTASRPRSRTDLNNESISANSIYVNTKMLNVRSDPGGNSPIVTKLAYGFYLSTTGEQVNINGESWVRVSTDDGIKGWANLKYLSLSPPAQQENQEQETTTQSTPPKKDNDQLLEPLAIRSVCQKQVERNQVQPNCEWYVKEIEALRGQE